MRAILAVVGIFGGDLDDINMGALCWICGPLDRNARPTDACDDTVEKLELQDEEMVEGFVSFPYPCLVSGPLKP